MFAASKPSVVAGNVTCSRAESLRHRLDAYGRDEVRLLFGGVHDLAVLLVMPPYAQRECAGKQQEHAEAKQPASGPAAPRGPAWR